MRSVNSRLFCIFLLHWCCGTTLLVLQSHFSIFPFPKWGTSSDDAPARPSVRAPVLQMIEKQKVKSLEKVFALPASSVGDNSPGLHSNLTIIAIGCNRPEGILRTLNSVKGGNVPHGAALHICIDACGVPEVEEVAKEFEWPYGKKEITVRQERFGLSKHIASCWENPLPGQWALFVEDDLVVAPHAFSAFAEALAIRAEHEHASNIVGIGLHDARVNQYCTNGRMHSMPCPDIQKLCNTTTETYSILGSLMCLHNQSHNSWILNQMPSSWGGFYEAKGWSMFQKYYPSRARLTVGESLIVGVPHSLSNEWTNSWKRFYMELMFNAGWTFMYRTHPEQMGFATTLRSSGAHTTLTNTEAERKCLVNLPLFNSSLFVADKQLSNNPNQIHSLDHCAGETSVLNLVKQGTASTHFLTKYYARNNGTSLRAKAGKKIQSDIVQTLRVLYQVNQMGKGGYDVPLGEQNGILSTGYDVAFLEKAEIIMLTTIKELDKAAKKMVEHFKTFRGSVHFLVVAPGKLCPKFRDKIHASCVDETLFRHEQEGSPKLPVLSKMLQAVADAAPPNVKWLGVMNGDIVFDGTLLKTLTAISNSSACAENDVKSRCVVTGQRVDVDWTSGKEKLHSEWGMDYFIFNSAAMEHILQDKLLPPFTIGLVRWDSWLMTFLSSSAEFNTIDASKAMKVLHFMDMEKAFSSKKSTNVWNLQLADQWFRLGRTDHANFQVDPDSGGLVPLVNADFLRQKAKSDELRYDFDGSVERDTHFKYTSGPMQKAYIRCFCDMMTMLVQPRNITEIPWGKFCGPSGLLKLSGNGPTVFFDKEIFEIAGNKTLDDLYFSSNAGLLTFPRGKTNASNACCVFIQPSDPPSEVPGKFWRHDIRAEEQAKCIIDVLL
jgi:hypothetical protein